MLRRGLGTALLLLLLRRVGARVRRHRRARRRRQERCSRSRPSRRRRPTRRRFPDRPPPAVSAVRDAWRAAAAGHLVPAPLRQGIRARVLAGRRRDAVPARAQPRVAVQVHEQHGDEPDVHGPQRRRARRPAAQRHPAGARRLLLLRLRLPSEARIQHPDLHLDRDAGRRRRPATRASRSQGVRAARRILLAAQHPLDDRHLSVLSWDRPEHVHQLLPTRFHAGDLGRGRAARRLPLPRDAGKLAEHAGHQVGEHRQPVRGLGHRLVRPRRLRQALERLRAPHVAGGARGDGVHLREGGSPVRSRRGRPGEQRDVHLGRPVPVRDGGAGAERHPSRSRTSTCGRSTAASSTRGSRSTSSSICAG